MAETICHYVVKAKARPLTQESLRYKKNGIWHSWSWPNYYEHIEKTAFGLKAMGLKEGQKVAIWSHTRHEWSLCDMAILGSRAVTVPIYQSSQPEEVVFILNDAEVEILILENSAVLEKWKKLKSECRRVKTVICIDAQESSEDAASLKDVIKRGDVSLQNESKWFQQSCLSTAIDELATIVYTSGTTGTPKGVMIAHEQIMSEVVDLVHHIELLESDRSLTFLPFAHILGRVEHWAHIYTGFCMAFAENIDRIKPNMKDVSPTFLIAVPRIFEKIYSGMIAQAEQSPMKNRVFNYALSIGRRVSQGRLENRTLSIISQFEYQLAKKLVFDSLSEALGGRLRYAFSGGAPLSPDIAKFFHAAGLLILEGYGLTETTAGVTANSPYDYRFGTVGKPCGDVQLKIADDGEILVKSKKIMTGYYKNEQATRDVFTDDGWFCTGDIGEITTDGFLRITDRKKDLIKTAGGKYVAPQKLENLLKLSKYVSNVVIHGDKRKYVVALITLNFEEINHFAEQNGITNKDRNVLVKDPKIKELIRSVVATANSRLASFESIKNFEILPNDFTIKTGELTPSLKVKRKFCDKKYASVLSHLYGD